MVRRSYLCTHDAAESLGLDAAIVFHHLGHMMTFIEQHIGEVAMFDPSCEIKEGAIRDGLKVSACLCLLMGQQAESIGITMEAAKDRWPTLLQAAITTEILGRRAHDARTD